MASILPAAITGGESDRVLKSMDANRYATKKTIAQGMLDIALLTANASQLKYILQVGEKHEFYTLMLTLISISIILQMIGMMGHCCLNVSGDMNIAYLLSIAGQQLDLLSCKFACLPVPRTGTSTEKDNYRRKFVAQIQQYNRIYEFARDIEKAVSLGVFAQICASGITICAIVFRLSSISIIDHLGTSIPMFFYMVSMLTQIFMPCYFGNDITLKSQTLTNALYTSEWYQLAMEDRKDMKMMMLRTGESIRLKAGGFFNFNLDAFTSTLNTAYSVYAVLNSQEKNKKER